MKLSALQGDITRLGVDAIVNAANDALIPGGGVDGAINRAAGPQLGQAMRAIGGCPTDCRLPWNQHRRLRIPSGGGDQGCHRYVSRVRRGGWLY
ncbi:MAG TPA: macro domain-containing protein [Gemmatimonadaceae bacterium]|jgi:hypothetical protein|nr:macro domain-containing protein [Gemmatimonadaceae bacterium]